jgi:biopolymer transport protein ExbD
MAMQVGSETGEDDVMMDMNTTPLIDVMLVLLILLIVTLPIQTHAVKLTMPAPDPTARAIPTVVDLEIDFDGTVLWNGRAVANRATLNGYFGAIAMQAQQPEVHFRPNRLAKYDIVARTLADAQRLGVKKIGFVGTDQYME